MNAEVENEYTWTTTVDYRAEDEARKLALQLAGKFDKQVARGAYIHKVSKVLTQLQELVQYRDSVFRPNAADTAERNALRDAYALIISAHVGTTPAFAAAITARGGKSDVIMELLRQLTPEPREDVVAGIDAMNENDSSDA